MSNASIVELTDANGMKKIVLTHSSGSSVCVYLFGATITSFKTSHNREVLFTSQHAVFDGTRPIRGGIPLVFPQFGAGKLVNHGFARTSQWAIDEQEFHEGVPRLVLQLKASTHTLALWPHEFMLRFEIRLNAQSLHTTLNVQNSGDAPFDFQMLQHTYLLLDTNISDARVHGLKDVSYIDQLENRTKKKQLSDVVCFNAEVDSIFLDAPDQITVNVGNALNVDIIKSSRLQLQGDDSVVAKSTDAVIWNPWIEKSKRMSDFGDEEYRSMVCVEPGIVAKFVNLPVGASWSLTQELRVS